MSTRSAIIERKSDGTYRGIYCHFDGYVEGVGKKLAAHYTDPALVTALLDLGDISSLGARLAPEGPHSFDDREQGATVAYMRDRGETGCEARTGATAKDVAGMIGHNGYVYVFEDGSWTVNGKSIDQALADEAAAE